jgi:hypothetical protein
MDAVCSSETRELIAEHTLLANHRNRFSTDEDGVTLSAYIQELSISKHG